MELLYAAARPFVSHPLRACIPVCVFVALAVILFMRRGHSRRFTPYLCAVIGAAWVLFALNEWAAKRHGWNIRVDLLFTWPPLFAGSAIAFVAGVVAVFRKHSPPRGAEGLPPAEVRPEAPPKP